VSQPLIRGTLMTVWMGNVLASLIAIESALTALSASPILNVEGIGPIVAAANAIAIANTGTATANTLGTLSLKNFTS